MISLCEIFETSVQKSAFKLQVVQVSQVTLGRQSLQQVCVAVVAAADTTTTTTLLLGRSPIVKSCREPLLLLRLLRLCKFKEGKEERSHREEEEERRVSASLASIVLLIEGTEFVFKSCVYLYPMSCQGQIMILVLA